MPHFHTKKRALIARTRESTWRTCRATCHCHITREFWLKPGKKIRGGQIGEKKSEGGCVCLSNAAGKLFCFSIWSPTTFSFLIYLFRAKFHVFNVAERLSTCFFWIISALSGYFHQYCAFNKKKVLPSRQLDFKSLLRKM